MGLFNNRQQAQAISQRQLLESKYANARRDVFIVLAFTVINLILLVLNTNTYFLVSAYVPYLIGDLAMAYCGKYPAEYYGGEVIAVFGDGVFAVLMGLVALILVMYLLCGLLSNKGRKGWLVFALVLFILDTAALVYVWATLLAFSADCIVDLIFHGWVVYSLAAGVSACGKLQKLPPEEEAKEDFMDAFIQPEQSETATSTEE